MNIRFANTSPFKNCDFADTEKRKDGIDVVLMVREEVDTDSERENHLL